MLLAAGFILRALPVQQQVDGFGGCAFWFSVDTETVISLLTGELADVRMIWIGDGARFALEKRSLNSTFEVLMATVRSSRVSRAFHTSPMPPAPVGHPPRPST